VTLIGVVLIILLMREPKPRRNDVAAYIKRINTLSFSFAQDYTSHADQVRRLRRSSVLTRRLSVALAAHDKPALKRAVKQLGAGSSAPAPHGPRSCRTTHASRRSGAWL
jgi:hypothetical protein